MARPALNPWYALYRRLQPLVDAYQGEQGVNLYIQALAEETGYVPEVISRILKAGKYLDSTVGLLEPNLVSCGYGHIELIERLHQLKPEIAQECLADCLSGEVTLQKLRTLVATHTNTRAHPGKQRSLSRSRVIEHDRRCAAALRAVGPGFFGFPHGELIEVTHSHLLGPFHMIKGAEGSQLVAILTQVGDTSTKAEYAVREMLKQALLAKSYFYKVGILLPQGSLLAAELVHQILMLGVQGIHLFVATLDQEAIQMQREDPNSPMSSLDLLAWNGVNTRNKREVGYLKPLVDKLIPIPFPDAQR